MFKIIAIVMTAFLLAGCGGNSSGADRDKAIEERNAQSKAEIEAKVVENKKLNNPDDTKINSTGNVIAKKIGTTGTMELPKGHKLLMVTYKQDNMWLLYRPMRPGEHAESYVFQEDSVFGAMEGTVRIYERE